MAPYDRSLPWRQPRLRELKKGTNNGQLSCSIYLYYPYKKNVSTFG